MIGCDDVDGSREQMRPQSILLDGVAQRRRTLRDGTQPFDIFFGEEKIVRASLDRDIRSFGAGVGSERNAAATADVNNVQLRAGFACEQRGALDGFEFGNDGPRCEERFDARAIVRNTALREFLTLRMHCDWQTQARRFAQAVEQCLVVGTRKFGQSGIAEERFEADDASIGQLRHFGDIAGNQSAPKSEVGD